MNAVRCVLVRVGFGFGFARLPAVGASVGRVVIPKNVISVELANTRFRRVEW